MNKISKKQTIQLTAVIVVVVGIFLIAHEAKAPVETTVGTPSAANLPQIDPASIGKIIKDPSTGKEFMSNQLIVEFKPDERRWSKALIKEKVRETKNEAVSAT